MYGRLHTHEWDRRLQRADHIDWYTLPPMLYALTLALIVITLLAVSLTRLGKVHTRADYLVAGRSLPAFVLVFTLLSSWIGSGSLLGGAENAYRHGFAALWQAAGGWAGLALIYFIAPRARRFAQFTIPDLLEARYNQAARVLGVIAILFTYTAITSYQFIGGGDILHLVFPFFGGLGVQHWKNKHNHLHHGHPNVVGRDPDMNVWPMALT